MKTYIFLCLLFIQPMIQAQTSLSLAVLKYNGGGDYYANPTALPNLIAYCNNTLGTKISEDVPYVEAGSKDLFLYPFIHMTGHGNVVFSKEEAEEFINKPQMKEAVEMRLFDDQAKILNKTTPSVEHFRKYVENSFQANSN